jgi:hypothetical protein
VDAAGEYIIPPAPSLAYGWPSEDPCLTLPLPWEKPAREQWTHALAPALLCTLLLGWWAWRRDWVKVAGLAVAFVGLAVIAAETTVVAERNSPRGPRVFTEHWPLHGAAILLAALYLGTLLFQSGPLSRSKKWVMGAIAFLLWACVILLFWLILGYPNGAELPDQLPVSWKGWYWMGPYALSLAGQFTLGAVVFWLVGWHLLTTTTQLLQEPRPPRQPRNPWRWLGRKLRGALLEARR